MHSRFARTSHAAFTLVELSIVLIIVGLIIAGILTGMDMIRSAGVRAQISQIEQFDSAVNAFRTRFHYLPGDIPQVKASAFGLPNNTGIGDGDNLIEDSSGNAPISSAWGESYYVFIQLANAGVLAGHYAYAANEFTIGGQFPATQTGAGGTIVTGNGGSHYYYLGLARSSTSNDHLLSWLSNASIITPAEAYGIDVKIDNGVPGTGNVTAVSTVSGTLDNTVAGCAVSGSMLEYNVLNEQPLCRLYVRANF